MRVLCPYACAENLCVSACLFMSANVSVRVHLCVRRACVCVAPGRPHTSLGSLRRYETGIMLLPAAPAVGRLLRPVAAPVWSVERGELWTGGGSAGGDSRSGHSCLSVPHRQRHAIEAPRYRRPTFGAGCFVNTSIEPFIWAFVVFLAVELFA